MPQADAVTEIAQQVVNPPAAAAPSDAPAQASPQPQASVAPATEPVRPKPPDGEQEPGRPRLRRLLEVPWRRAKSPEPVAAEPESAAPVRRLAYLLITGEAVTRDPTARQRGKAALLAVDNKMAGLQEANYTVRLLEGDEDHLRGEARPAGQLSKRELRNPVLDADFAGVLREIRRLLRRDVARYAGSGQPLARPAVVFFASDPPLADPVTVEAFAALAEEALIMWVFPRGVRRLMSSALTDLDGTHVLGDGEDVADDIADLLIADAVAAASRPREQPEAEISHTQ